MARIFAYLLLVASLSTYVAAVPVQSQTKKNACDVAIQETMKDLQLSSSSIDKLMSSKDPNVLNAAMIAHRGLRNANTSFELATSALEAGQDVPSDTITELATNLSEAQSAMSNVTSASQADTGKLKRANSVLNSTVTATEVFVIQCELGTGTVDGGAPATGGDSGSTGTDGTVDGAPATGAAGDGSDPTSPSSTGVQDSGTDGTAPSGTSGNAPRHLGSRFAQA